MARMKKKEKKKKKVFFYFLFIKERETRVASSSGMDCLLLPRRFQAK
jgi:hypothetical protein